MKKKFCLSLILSLFILSCLVGCSSSWEKVIELSNLKIENEYVVGKIKNKTEKYLEVVISLKLKNGGLTDDDLCHVDIKPNEIKDLKCLSFGYDSSYDVEVKSVKYSEKTIPTLKDGVINTDTLKYYFEDIYDSHDLNVSSLITSYGDVKYPPYDEIKYSSIDNEISIDYSFKYKNINVSYFEKYNTKTNQPTILFAIVSNNDETTLYDFISKFSIIYSFLKSSSASSISTLNKTLRDKNIEYGRCMKIGSWCAFSIYDDTTVTLALEKN